MHEALFTPVRLGAIEAPNRILMAPLTRGRADPGAMPNARIAEYYRQRASAGLIISEATAISTEGYGWHAAPAIATDQQAEAWKPVTEAVHQAGGRIVLQLWHMGRIVHSDYLGGQPPVSASATTAPDHAHTPTGRQPHVQARAATLDDIKRIIDDYGKAAARARAAGFDGVQLHGANGYLIDQFLRSGSNSRTDEYGGSVENRARFGLQVTDAVASVWGADRVGIRLSPNGKFNDMYDADPAATFGYMVKELAKRNLAYLHVVERMEGDEILVSQSFIRSAYSGKIIANGGYTAERAEAALAEGVADLIAFGKLFLANPDLPRRFAEGAPLNEPDPTTFYGGDERGYTDYPVL